MNPKWIGSESVAYAAFGGQSSGVADRDVFELHLSSSNRSVLSSVTLEAIQVPVSCAPLYRPTPAASVTVELSHLPMAGRPPPDEPLHVHVLIGMNYFWRPVGPAVHCTQGVRWLRRPCWAGWCLAWWLLIGGSRSWDASFSVWEIFMRTTFASFGSWRG